MESTNSAASIYLNDHFYSIYPDQGLEDITKADLIILGLIQNDIFSQMIHQSFINLFPNALALIPNEERGKICKHKECEFSWNIQPHVIVEGWNDSSHIRALKENCPSTLLHSKIQCIALYQKLVKTQPSKKNPLLSENEFFKSIARVSLEAHTFASINIRDHLQCQASMLEAVKDGLQQDRRPVFLYGNYANVKITPNGYEHPDLKSYFNEQMHPFAGFQLMYSKDEAAAEQSTEILPEPLWRQKFHEMFEGKKIVFLVHKPAIIAASTYLDKTTDYMLHDLENNKVPLHY